MTQDYISKWNRCLDIVRDNIGQSRFDTWFACARLVAFDNNRLTIGLPSQFFYEKYEDDFYNILKFALRKEFGNDISLDYQVGMIANDDKAIVTLGQPTQSHVVGSKLTRSMQKPANPEQPADSNIDPQLNPQLNFANYCVGESNRLAHTIADYIARHPKNSDFNPFFLYGDVGVGKTHLMQAIGIKIKEDNPNARVLFTTSRMFQNMYASAQIKHTVPSFINWFQQIDVLLLDDLQELATKVKTTDDALFPIFNYLHQNGKQLVFTCDRPPMELDGIADRLIDRFKWGITEQLPRPDLALRKQILNFKARKNGLDIPEDVIQLIAECADKSVRELEGIVMGLLTRSITLNAPIDIALAREVMKNSIKRVERKIVNFDMIVESTAEFFNLQADVIFSKSRVRDIADARQVIMYLAHKLTGLSSSAIGQKLNRQHATVLHGISAITDRIPYSKELETAVNTIEDSILK